MRNTEAEFLAEKFRKECSDLEKIDQKVVETLRQTNSELTTTVTEQASEIIHIRKQLQEFCLQHSPGDKDAKANEAHREVIDELKQLLEKERHATKEQTFKYKELLQKITEIEKRHELQIFKLNEQLCKEKLTIKSLQEVAKAKAALETENEQLKIILQEKPTKEGIYFNFPNFQTLSY
ncbi:uncharacterized protein LOC135121285 [Zophobas morio]|uniref:uncharacterized protein LOC135121285 n=1 Tax=Zophobas morio TaxID=2755281 RepID=UPI003083D646